MDNVLRWLVGQIGGQLATVMRSALVDILVGCRSLLFRACRALHAHFPNAVIIGFVSSNVGNSVSLL